MAKACRGKVGDWPKLLPYALWADCTTRYMPFELMYGQKPIMPTEETILSWSSIPWMEDMEREDLLALRTPQLERRQEDVDKAVERLKKARLKSKEKFDKRHRLRPREIKKGD